MSTAIGTYTIFFFFIAAGEPFGECLSARLSAQDAPAKPDPTGVLAICNDWGLSPPEVLFVGDYLFDLQAGHNAGTNAALFAPGVLPEWADLADWVVSSFGELEELIERLCLEA